MDGDLFSEVRQQEFVNVLSDALTAMRSDYEIHLVSNKEFGNDAAEAKKQWFPDTRDAKVGEYFFAVAYRLLQGIKQLGWIADHVWRIEGCKGVFGRTMLTDAFPEASLEAKENLVDLSVVVDEHAKDVWFAAELECDKQPSDAKEDRREEDFRKLLNCTAAVKLFVGRSQLKDGSPAKCCEALVNMFERHHQRLVVRGVMAPCHFAVVVFPTEARRHEETAVHVVLRDINGCITKQVAKPFADVGLTTVGRGRPPLSTKAEEFNRRIKERKTSSREQAVEDLHKPLS